MYPICWIIQTWEGCWDETYTAESIRCPDLFQEWGCICASQEAGEGSLNAAVMYLLAPVPPRFSPLHKVGVNPLKRWVVQDQLLDSVVSCYFYLVLRNDAPSQRSGTGLPIPSVRLVLPVWDFWKKMRKVWRKNCSTTSVLSFHCQRQHCTACLRILDSVVPADISCTKIYSH